MHEGRYDFFTDEDKAQFTDIVRDGAAAIFLYARTVLANKKLRPYDPTDHTVRAIARSSIILVPECFFEDYLDIHTSCEGETIVLSDDNHTLHARIEETEYSFDGQPTAFPCAPCAKGSHTYLPAQAVCERFSIPVGCFYDNMLLVMGSKSVLQAMRENPRLGYAGGYAVLGEFSTDGLTSEDYSTVKDKWRLSLVGSRDINEAGDPEMAQKLRQISENCRRAWESMHRTDDAIILWGNEPPTESEQLTAQYNQLRSLAMGYGTTGSEYYGNENLKDDILWALNWLNVHMYGDSVIEGRGWRDAHTFNWWDWNVGSVFPLTDVLLIMEEYLSMEQKQRYLKCFRWTTTFMRVGYRYDFASSRILGFLKTALLLEDAEWLRKCSEDYDLLLQVVEEGAGTHIDYVNWTHGYPYNMMYGLTNLQRTLYAASQLAGTRLELRSPRQYGFYHLARYMFEAAIYVGQGFMLFNGRANGGTEFSSGAAAFSQLLNMIGMFGEDEDRYLKRMIKRNAVDPDFVRLLKSNCSIRNLSLLNEILNDPSISAENDYTLAHAWYTADRAVQHRRDYCFFLGMASCRHPGYESINSANKRGWYTGDGALYLYTHTDRHSFDGPNFITNERVTYQIPGATVDDGERTVKSLRTGWCGSAEFVGCMQFDRQYIIAAMDYESYHFEGPDENIPDTGYGGSWPVHENDLRAKKAWFMFDRECVCLGTDIRSTMNADVNTIVEHRRLPPTANDSSGIPSIYLNGSPLSAEPYELVCSEPHTVNLDGFAGFWFPEGRELSLTKYNCKSAENRDHYTVSDPEAGKHPDGKLFFEMHLKHGKNPNGESYAYVILPYTTDEELRAYANRPDIEILANSPELQAVRCKSASVTGLIFWKAGQFENITVDQPCIVTVGEDDHEIRISVCDPTQKRESMHITIAESLSPVFQNSDKISVNCSETASILVDSRLSVGRDFHIRFKKKC